MLSLRRHRNISRLLLLIFGLLAGRLLQINYSHAADYTAQVQRQRLLAVEEREYSRGDILDCNGQSFTNRAERVLLVFPRLLPENSETYWVTYLNTLLKNKQLQASATVSSQLKQQLTDGQPFILARNLSLRQLEELQPVLAKTNGIYATIIRPRYGADGLAAHLIGYVGGSNTAEAEALTRQGNQDTAYIGKSGLEKQYDALLRGQTSAHIAITVDEKNRPAAEGLRYIAAGNGKPTFNLQLTLNYNYQAIAEAAMQDKNGAAVLMDVKTGDVLAMVSAPGYNQYIGQPATEGDIYVNKALSYYPPASVFKIVLCLAALDHNISIDNTGNLFNCSGSITLPNGHQVGCWNSDGHGEENIGRALGNSCNPYFIQLGQSLGGSLIGEYAYRLGLTEQVLSGFKLSQDDSTSRLSFNPAVPADVANVSIGEKGIRATPLMLARLLAAVANDGQLPTPRLVQAVLDDKGRVLSEIPSAQPQQVVQAASARQVKQWLVQAVQEGTGKPAASDLISIAGKTGTSQNFGVWFAGFFPADEPRWSIAVYIADGQSGGSDAGGVCREIAEKIAILEDITNTSKV